MAFPFEPSQLRAQLRAFSLATADSDLDCAARIVKPLRNDLFHQYYNDLYLRDFEPHSPPIPYDLPSHGPSDLVLLFQHKRTKRPERKKPKKHAKSDSIAATVHTHESSSTIEDVSDSLVTTLPMEHAPDAPQWRRRLKGKGKNPLSKLILAALRTSSPSLSPQDSLRTADGSVDFGEQSARDYPGADNHSLSDTEERPEPLVDGEAVIVNEMEGRDPQHVDSDLDSDGGPDDTLGESSSDSAFTDIEGDSLARSTPSLMYDYTVPDSFMLKSSSDLKFPKLKRSKSKRGALLLNKSKSTASLLQDVAEDTDLFTANRTPFLRRRTSFTFEKLYDAVGTSAPEKESNLSVLIKSRFKSANVNPLSYFAFAKERAEGVKHARIDVFVPPKMQPVLKAMEISSNVTIFDCIGYILLSICSLPEFEEKKDVAFMDPNNWRMELIDEDGELYDSTFGVLDRTRLLSSYNCPTCLALCKVTNLVEISSNVKQTPLPLEFRQSLDTFEKRITSPKMPESEAFSSVSTEMHSNSIEVKVGNIPHTSSTNYVSFFVSSTMKVGDLLHLICSQYQVDSHRYMLAEVELPTGKDQETLLKEDLVNNEPSWKHPLDNSRTLSALDSNTFRLVPNIAQKVRPLTDVKANLNSFLEASITPSSCALTPSAITPPVKQLEGKFQELAVSSKEDSPDSDLKVKEKPKTPSLKIASNSSLGELIHGKSPQLAASFNPIYLKWKVYRKKSPILNRIEKSLIIDGDYIHLAPTDDTNWKKNPYENPFVSNQNSHHHHHHYLHHYNYSKYYNDTMMKTSSFHITQIVKLKQYKQTKNPTHFKIVIQKESDQGGKETIVKKKYDLEAETVEKCDEIIENIKWALQVHKMSGMT